VPEYAREYIENLKRPYQFEDVEAIARKQLELEKENMAKARNFLFYDTFLLITKVWFDVVYQKTPDWFLSRTKQMGIDLFLLCDTGIPWVPDPVRENGGEKREKLLQLYKQELSEYCYPFIIVKGKQEERFQNALKGIRAFFGQ
jgi:nicotinamide riboside kinase